MGTTSQKLTYLNDTKTKIRDGINAIGGSLDSDDTFRSYVDELESLYNDMPKVSDTDTDISLDGTRVGKMTMQYGGDTQQDSTTGKNLFNKSTITGITNGSISNDVITSNAISTDYGGVSSTISGLTLQAGTYYITAKVKLNSGTSGGITRITMIGVDTTDMEMTINPSLTSNYQVYCNKIVISEPKTITNIGVQLKPTNTNAVVSYTDIMVSSSSDTTYEPYTNGPAPNPQFPMPIQVVTGRNDINVCGKNLFIPTLTNNGVNIQTAKCTATLNGDEYTLTATDSDMCFGIVSNVGSVYENRYGTLYQIGNATKIYLYLTNSTFNKNYINWYDENKISLGYLSIQSSSGYKDVPENAKYFSIRFGYGTATSGTSYTTKVMVSYNEITEYEAYTGYTQEINLGKNLFDKDTTNILTGYIGDTGFNPYANNRVVYIPTKEGQIYTIQKFVGSGNLVYAFTENTPTIGTQTLLNRTDTSVKTTTVTAPTNGNYLAITIYRDADYSDSFTVDEVLSGLQIEKGSQASTYSSYFTPIELCKISTYQDYIYKTNDKWYIHKEIGKKTFTGASGENWTRTATNTSGYYRFLIDFGTNIISSIPSAKATIFSNNFVGVSRDNTYVSPRKNGFAFSDNSYAYKSIILYYEDVAQMTVSDFKNWLSTHNTSLYYPLAEPTETEITNSTLINQLENIKRSIDGQTNISQDNSDLPFIITASALKEWE